MTDPVDHVDITKLVGDIKFVDLDVDRYATFKGSVRGLDGKVTFDDDISVPALDVTGTASASDLDVNSTVTLGPGTTVAVAGVAELNKTSGTVTTEDLTTASGSSYSLTLNNTAVAVGDVVMASVGLGTSTAGVPMVTSVQVGAALITIGVKNDGPSAFDGNLTIAFVVFKGA